MFVGGLCGGVVSGYNIVAKYQPGCQGIPQDSNLVEYVGQGVFGVFDGMLLGCAWPLTFPVVIGMISGKIIFAVKNAFGCMSTPIKNIPIQRRILYGNTHSDDPGDTGLKEKETIGPNDGPPCNITHNTSTQTECASDEEEEYVV